MDNNKIINIPVEEIYQHPDNPRKDLGDLSELSESIRKKGIMQNLTVIPGHWITSDEWSVLSKEYSENPSEEIRNKMNTIHTKQILPEGYTLIIGHRRLAAAKMAGLKSVPCRIIDEMNKTDQVATMLEENMQRSALTIGEQASGFQMMLDLGETTESISKKTGFSKTTVNHRLNIAKLDQEVLKEKETDHNFQLSLGDLYLLEQVKDIATRNEILSTAKDSRDLAWKAKRAVEEIKRENVATEIINMLKEAGIEAAPEQYKKEMYSGKWEILDRYSLEEAAPEQIEKEKLAGGSYCQVYREIHIVKKKDKSKEPESEYEKQKKECSKKAKAIRAIAKEMTAQRESFIRNILSGKIEPLKDTEKVIDKLWSAIVYANGFVGKIGMARFLANTKEDWYNIPGEDKIKVLKELDKTSTLHQMMIGAYVSTSNLNYTDYGNHYNEQTGKAVTAITEALNEYGFSYSDDEQNKIMDGTHEFYKKEEHNASEN